MKNRSRQNGFARAVKKFFLYGFVVATFSAYALENHAGAGGAAAPGAGSAAASVPAAPGAGNVASSAPAAPSTASGGYKDGTYTGPVVDVNWGYVQVQATIQGGKISNVQFLQYPSDRFDLGAHQLFRRSGCSSRRRSRPSRPT